MPFVVKRESSGEKWLWYGSGYAVGPAVNGGDWNSLPLPYIGSGGGGIEYGG